MSTAIVKSVAAVMVFVSVAASLDCDRGKIGMGLGCFFFFPGFVQLIFIYHFLTGKQPSRQNMNECYSLRLNLLLGVYKLNFLYDSVQVLYFSISVLEQESQKGFVEYHCVYTGGQLELNQ